MLKELEEFLEENKGYYYIVLGIAVILTIFVLKIMNFKFLTGLLYYIDIFLFILFLIAGVATLVQGIYILRK